MIVGILLFQAAAFAVLSGIVANKKNRDPAGWGFLGFVFGLFAFIAALVVETVETEEDEPEEDLSKQADRQPAATRKFDPEEHDKKCLMCAERIKLEARVCRYCGHEFTDEEVENAVEKKRRQSLGHSLPDDVDERYCHLLCGEVTEESHAEPPYWVCEECADEVPVS